MPRRDDLGKPRGSGVKPSYDPDRFGRMAEAMARYLGTGRYLAIQTMLVFVWIALNLAAARLRWDPYPFILLNLAFSTQAAYAAPMILLAQNRQADRDRVEIERDRDTNARQLAEAEFLAREIAALRIAIERKADREDLSDAVREITIAFERLLDQEVALESPAAPAGERRETDHDSDHDHDRREELDRPLD